MVQLYVKAVFIFSQNKGSSLKKSFVTWGRGNWNSDATFNKRSYIYLKISLYFIDYFLQSSSLASGKLFKLRARHTKVQWGTRFDSCRIFSLCKILSRFFFLLLLFLKLHFPICKWTRCLQVNLYNSLEMEKPTVWRAQVICSHCGHCCQ